MRVSRRKLIPADPIIGKPDPNAIYPLYVNISAAVDAEMVKFCQYNFSTGGFSGTVAIAPPIDASLTAGLKWGGNKIEMKAGTAISIDRCIYSLRLVHLW